MTTQPPFLPDAGPFTMVSSQQAVNHGVNGRYQVVLYGAYNAHGRIASDRNGVGILIEPRDGARGAVVCDELGLERLSRVGHPTDAQIALYEALVAMPWAQFQATINRSDRTRFKL